MNKKITSSWKAILEKEFEKPYFKEIENFVETEAQKGKVVYPIEEDVFAVFNQIDFEKVKVVVLGQDPYHGENQAQGFSFSVPKSEKVPPSLKNIYKEISSDLGLAIPKHGNLIDWVNQGVFLLNAVLTVNAKDPASHKKAGWGNFTDKVIKTFSSERENLVFLLWGNFAKKKAELIDSSKHLILESAHPSPFSAYNGFFGNKHFSKTNTYLKEKNLEEINWEIKDDNVQKSLFD